MLRIDIISVQPQMFRGFLEESIVARAVKKGACEVNVVDLRDFGEGKWKKVDDKPYGGGPGMLMKCGPWFEAVESCRPDAATRVIMTSPAGKTFTQRDAETFAGLAPLPSPDHLIFLCGHYEGMDERVLEEIVDEEVSIGGYGLTGGELPALVLAVGAAFVPWF